MPMLYLRLASPNFLVDISGLEELKETIAKPDSIRIGALTTHAAVEDGKIPDVFGGLMRKVAAKISYRAVRNYGTIGGSVALADPAADWPGCLMVLGAVVRISGLNGVRSQPISEFLQGQYATSLSPDEIIVGLDVPRPDAALRWGFFKVMRKSGAFANSIAFVVARGSGGPVSVVLAGAAGCAHLLPTVAEFDQVRTKLGRSPTSRNSEGPGGPRSSRRSLSHAPAFIDHPTGRARDECPMSAVTIEVNGAKVTHDVEPRLSLADFLRDRCGLTATHLGCEHGACGACTVAVDGQATRSCLRLAVMCAGRSVQTLEGLEDDPMMEISAPTFPRTPCIAVRVLHAGNVDDGSRHSVARG